MLVYCTSSHLVLVFCFYNGWLLSLLVAFLCSLCLVVYFPKQTFVLGANSLPRGKNAKSFLLHACTIMMHFPIYDCFAHIDSI